VKRAGLGLSIVCLLLLAVFAVSVVTGTRSGPAAAQFTMVHGNARGDAHTLAHTGTSGAPALCRVTPHGGAGRPLLLVVGASYTAGVGAHSPAGNWAVRLAELLGWRAVTFGVPGAGYVSPGRDDLGPVSRELTRVDVARLDPSIVIVQAGHDDWQVPPGTESARVASLVRLLEAEAPHARLVFLTVFSRPGASGAVLDRELAVDSAIVSAVRRADPHAVVIDPLREHWQFPRIDGGRGLHPTAQGHLLIAERVAHALGVKVTTAAGTSSSSVSCTSIR
jgi:lysophospholipase L1-like esterase